MKRIAALCLTLTGCGADTGARPAVEIRTVVQTVEVAKPCAATVPPRPGKLMRPLPTDSVALAAILGSGLLAYAGPGGWADRMEAAIAICTKPAP